MRSWRGLFAVLIAAGMLWLQLAAQREQPAAADAIVCNSPYIIDGDTFDCAGTRIRLQGIDAPEMPGHCAAGRRCTAGNPFAARTKLIELTRDEVVCKRIQTDRYGRTVAICRAGDKDLSCSMLEAGQAARRYAPISCPD